MTNWGYTFDSILGAGAFGTVYKATENSTCNVCAIKCIAIGQPEDTKRICKEVQSHKRLSHENVVKFYDYHSFPNDFWIVMEYCDVGSLNAFLLKWNPSWNILGDFVQQVCCGVNHLHSQGVIHRDIKPDNIMMCKRLMSTGLSDYTLKIADFGLSKVWGDFNYQLPFYNFTNSIRLKYYSAPEVIDIFSLGCLVLAIFARTTILWFGYKPLLAPYIEFETGKLQIAQAWKDQKKSYIQGLPWGGYAGLPDLVFSMVQQNWEDRPNACTVLDSVIKIRSQITTVRTKYYYPAVITMGADHF